MKPAPSLNDDSAFSWTQASPRSAEPKVQPIKTVEQARIDRIWSPGPLVWQSYFRWLWTFKRRPAEYDDLTLTAWLSDVRADLETLRTRQRTPPPEWRGPEWEKGQDQLERLLGAELAIAETLRLRHLKATGGSTYTPSCRRTTSTPAPGRDPFADE